MKKLIAAFILAAFTTLTVASVALAAEEKMVGNVTKIEVAGDKKSATVTLKDGKSGKEVKVLVTDEVTLDKFKDKRIVDGDEVRVKYDSADKNKTKLFRKTAGC
jgi:spermidine/putrescine-binding protein